MKYVDIRNRGARVTALNIMSNFLGGIQVWGDADSSNIYAQDAEGNEVRVAYDMGECRGIKLFIQECNRVAGM